jgi:hypothetical protein
MGRSSYLRSLLNKKTLDPNDQTLDDQGKPNLVSRGEPHELSEVLSGALYSIMVKLHSQLTERWITPGMGKVQASGKALGVGSKKFRRFILRALDYLPPGEISFADYGRAIIAADQASHPQDREMRDWLTDEFARRAIVPDGKALKVKTNFKNKAVEQMDLDATVRSDWAAYEFANKNRKLLGIPPKIPFRVLPRLDATKLYYERGGQRRVRECLFKVSWDQTEPNALGSSFPSQRTVSVGTTLAIDWETNRIRSLLTSDLSDQQVKDRDALLNRLVQKGLLVDAEQGQGPDGSPLRFLIQAETVGDVMQVRGAARMLHMAAEEESVGA